MAAYTARFLDLTEEEPGAGERRFRVVFESMETTFGAGSEADWRRCEVVVPIGEYVVEAFWKTHKSWRPAPEWAAYFAATRHEVLEALAESGETSVELERSEDLADHAPPPDAVAEPWPPQRIIAPVAAPRAPATASDPSRPRSRFARIPRLSVAQERKVPLLLAGFGAAVSLITSALTAGEGEVGSALGAGVVELLVGVATALFGCWVAAWVLKSDFGYIGLASIKLLAIGTVPGAVVTLFALLLMVGPTLGLLGLLLVPVLYFGLYFYMFAWLFDLDALEVGVTVVVIVVLRYVVLFTIAMATA